MANVPTPTPGPTTSTADPELAKLLQEYAATAGPADPKKPSVYWGQKSIGDQGGEFHGGADIRQGDDIAQYDWAQNNFYTWDDTERAAWGQRLYKAGLLKDPTDYDGMLKAWNYAVDQAAAMYTYGGRKITPFGFIDLIDGMNGEKPTSQTARNTQVNYQIPSVSEATASIKTMFQQMLGRDPTDGEIERYRSMWIGQARKNPTTTTSTVTSDLQGNTSTSTTSSGGFDPSGFLPDQVKGDPEWGAFQAATSYYSALMDLAKAQF